MPETIIFLALLALLGGLAFLVLARLGRLCFLASLPILALHEKPKDSLPAGRYRW